MEESAKQRRQRAVLSCNDCRRRKLKCDRGLPCNRCIKGNIAESCAYEGESRISVSDPLCEHSAKRQKTPSARRGPPMTDEEPRSHIDVPKLFNASDFTKSDVTAEDRVRHLERQVALLHQQLLAQRTANLEAPRVSRPLGIEDSSPVILKGILKGRHYGSFYYGPSSPSSIMAYFPELRAFMKTVYHHSTAQRLAQDMQEVENRARTMRSRCRVQKITSLRSLLPDRSTTDRLVRKYLDTFETTYRVVHVPSFQQAYERYWDLDNSDVTDMDALVLAILACTICTSALESPRYDYSGSTLHKTAVRYIKACEAWLRRQSSKHRTLVSLQVRCLRLLALSTASHKAKDYFQEVRAHISLMISCGMHRDPVHFGDRCSVFDGEMRRRLWATSVEIELQASVDKGTASIVSSIESDCAAPQNVDDIDLRRDMDDLPQWRPSIVFTDASFLFASMRSLELRAKVCALANSSRTNLSFADNLVYSNALQKCLESTPDWSHPRALQARTLLDLQLRQLIIILNAASAIETRPGTSSERRYAIISLLENAAATVNLHTALTATSNLALCCSRSDYYRAALLVCHVAYYASRNQDAMMAQIAKATFDGCLHQAISLQEERVLLAGRGGQQHWVLSAAVGLVDLQFEPSQHDAIKLQAIDRVSRLLYKMLSLRDTSGEATANEVLLEDSPLAAKQVDGQPDLSTTLLSSETFANAGLRLDAFDLGDASEWMFDDFWFLNELDVDSQAAHSFF